MPLITPAEAERLILASVPTLPVEDCPLASAHGRILRAPIRADRDFPPFDRVTMDGFALRHSAVAAGRRAFRIQGFQPAGTIPLALESDETCIEIATGAVLPNGCDCVVPYEDTDRSANSSASASQPSTLNSQLPTSASVTLSDSIATALTPGQSIHHRGSDASTATELIPSGTRLTSREIAVAASCGSATLRVSLLPRIAVIATGDELVEVENPSPAPHQIRRSNDHALRAALLSSGYGRVERFHLRDLKYELETQLKRFLSEFDVLLLTGGVSKGKYDFLPTVLAELGVEKKFHGVAQRPGKPFWFGLTSRRVPVFALPGNPVSTLTCFHRYVIPALSSMSADACPRPEYAALAAPFTFKPALAPLVPVRLESTPDARLLAHISPTNTSGDFAGLLGTDGFLELPCGPLSLPAGHTARVHRWS
ncbi:molybdopterin molybdenumtransferase MoeA [Nibricoccus aquaticus]|uniref:Molybdopterin molybdenumtransferase n=1 Tax=Nibricoccus aquaticus TaxID=2576891 RepID=A0A290Q6Q7_9BACT|nr:molybdopterin molybdotransferase MoeA [Nibricoccus aquaticus]ATC64184.1 molybdopterin molybdenumtransferase MoeA [Nibricoccus aquaticus]